MQFPLDFEFDGDDDDDIAEMEVISNLSCCCSFICVSNVFEVHIF